MSHQQLAKAAPALSDEKAPVTRLVRAYPMSSAIIVPGASSWRMKTARLR